jgi:O-antigen ligase
MLAPVEFSFFLGTLRLTALRVYLIFLVFFFLAEFVRSKRLKLTSFDGFLLMFAGWSFVSFSVVHGIERGLEAGGIFFLETVPPYFLARLYIVDWLTMRRFTQLVMLTVVLSLLVTVPEALFGKHYIHDWASSITGSTWQTRLEQRLGIWRAMGSFDHPILYGVYCATLLGFVWYTASVSKRVLNFCIIAVSTVLSGSSGPILVLGAQMGLIIWERASRSIQARWYWLCSAGVAAYMVVTVFSNRPPLHVLIDYITINSFTAWIRIAIWDAGIASILQNPVFGIGFDIGTHQRPSWLTGSVDSFWLVFGMMQGFPSVLLLLISIGLLLRAVFRAQLNTPRENSARLGWVFAFFAMCVGGVTVHYWSAMHAYFFLIMGMGAWIAESKPSRSTSTPRRI